jgi:hypothetical protein
MRDCPNRFVYSQPRDQTMIESRKKLSLVRTALQATWFSTRRIVRFPFGERLLLDFPALSSRPGQTPIQDAICRRIAPARPALPRSTTPCTLAVSWLTGPREISLVPV